MARLSSARLIFLLAACAAAQPAAGQEDAATGQEILQKMQREQQASETGRAAIEAGDYEGGLATLRRESKKGNEYAKLDLCLLHMVDTTPEQYRDLVEGFAECKYLAVKGYPGGQHMLGRMYMAGLGVEKNLNNAAFWFKEAAEGNDKESQYFIGIMYATGTGVPQDPVLAHHWLNLAAGQGHEEAAKMRDTLRRSMSRNELEEANRITRQFTPRQ